MPLATSGRSGGTARAGVSAMETRVCTRCGEEKPLGAFKKDLRTPSGHGQPCKECDAAYKRNKYHTDPAYRERHLEYNAEYNARRWREDPMVRMKNSIAVVLYQARKSKERALDALANDQG